jgi:hypothetical protein
MRGTRKAIIPALRQVVADDIDRILFLTGAVVTALAEKTLPFVIGASAIGLIVVFKLRGSFRRALKLHREKHVPVVVAVGCSQDDFRSLVAKAFEAMRPYGFNEALYNRDYGLFRDDFTDRHEENLPDKPDAWKRMALREKRMVSNLHSRLSGKKLCHFFLRCPNAYAIGFGAALGTKYDLICHHYQPGAGDSEYYPLIELTQRTAPNEGAHILKSKVKDFDCIITKGTAEASGKVYVAIGLAGHHPTTVEDMANADSASFVDMTSRFTGTIPIDADWLLIAREINTVLLSLLERKGVDEIHLFPALPVCLAFAVGMGLDNRSPVRVHWWNAAHSKYVEVLRLNELKGE